MVGNSGYDAVTVAPSLSTLGRLKWSLMTPLLLHHALQGIGEFQCYDRRALASLASAARAAGHPEWGNSGPSNAGSYNSHPDVRETRCGCARGCLRGNLGGSEAGLSVPGD